MSGTLAHLTLNTGHIRESPRDEVGADILAVLAPLVAEDGGPLPPPFGGYHLTIARGEGEAAGSALYTFTGARGLPLATCLICWRPEIAAETWARMVTLRTAAVTLGVATMPANARRPATVPWLAVLLWPSLAFDRGDALSWLGDAERVIAWALIEEGR